MAVTPDREHCEEQVRRILRSATFRNAVTLQQLFSYLAAKSAGGTSETPKEYTIGVEALGRRDEFDPKIDPIVRVQSHRLRTKLKEYYAAEGSHDPVLIQIPKGQYLPTFEIVAPGAASPAHVSELSESHAVVSSADEPRAHDHHIEEPLPATAPARTIEFNPRWAFVVVAALAVAAFGFWFGTLYARGHAAHAASRLSPAARDPVELFWARVLGDDKAPVIAYTDAVFLLDDSNDLFRYRRGATDGRGSRVEPHLAREFASNPQLVSQAGPLYFENGYTGTGELESVGMLSSLLGRMGVRPTIKSSRDLSPDDLAQHNVILLGSPFQNVAVAQLLTSGDFVFDNPDQHHEQWRAQITNTHPRPGEAASYGTERDPDTRVLTSDHGLISIVPGMVPGRYIVDLGGLDTRGSQGATRFATTEFGVDQIMHALGSGIPSSGPPIFQALVRVRLAKGYQVLKTELVALHPIPAARASHTRAADLPAQH